MEQPEVMLESNLAGLGPPRRGKVRDIYDLDQDLLVVATDRISAFDEVLPNGIPDKGKVLNLLSALWLQRLARVIPNHLISCDPDQYPPACRPHAKELRGRSMLVRKARPLPVECVVRGYLTGSAWKSYQKNGIICGIQLPAGLVESQQLPEPIFTPSTKAQTGHDVNISFAQLVEMVGEATAPTIRDVSLELYGQAQALAEPTGIIIADTKFEFGFNRDGKLILIDEVLTPDSSRFWPADSYRPGGPQPSLDKQPVRDWLEQSGWNKQPPAPQLPPWLVEQTSQKYLEIYGWLAEVLMEPTRRA